MGFFSRVHRHDVAHFSKGVRNNLTLRYDMAGIVSDTLNILYDIKGIVSQTLELIYSIPISFVRGELEVIYNVRTPLHFGFNVGTFTAVPSNDMGDFVT